MATSTSWIPQAGTLCRSSLIPGLLRYCPTGRGLHLCLEVLSNLSSNSEQQASSETWLASALLRAFSFAASCFLHCSRFRSFSFSRTCRSFSLACKQDCLSSCHRKETSPPRLRLEQLSTLLASSSLPPCRQPCASFLPACTMLTLFLGLGRFSGLQGFAGLLCFGQTVCFGHFGLCLGLGQSLCCWLRFLLRSGSAVHCGLSS